MKGGLLETLRATELFSDLDEETLVSVAAACETERYAAGTTVFSADSPAAALYVVADGRVSIRAPDEAAGREIALIVAGESFGEMELLTGSRRSAAAIAEADASLVRFPRANLSLETLLEERPDSSARLLRSFLRVIAARIRRANDLLKENAPWVQELRRQAYGDVLTGLYNKTYLEERLVDFLGVGGRAALLMFKPDNFKEINDTFGHDAGDETIRRMAFALRPAFPAEVPIVRYLGNEFALVIVGIGREEAAAEARRIITILGEVDLKPVTGGVPFTLTASVGYALYPDHAREPEALIAAAHALPLIGRGRGGGLVLGPEDA